MPSQAAACDSDVSDQWYFFQKFVKLFNNETFSKSVGESFGDSQH